MSVVAPPKVDLAEHGVKARPLFDPPIVKQAIIDSFTKLNPKTLMRNPVIFVVEVVSVVVTLRIISDIVNGGEVAFDTAIALGLWFTVLFANFAEAMAEGRGKAQAESLRRTRADLVARRVLADGSEESVAASDLRAGDLVMVSAGELVPGDGDIVTGGTKVLSDWIKIRITAEPGEGFIDRMIRLVEGAERQKTPNEIALSLLLVKFTIIFLMVIVALQPFAIYAGPRVSDAVLIALFVCLIPTTIGGLLSAIGIAGMDRLVQRNVLAMSGRAVEAAGDVSALLLDKTGTITLGNRQAVAFIPAPGVDERDLAEVAQMASLADETPEGRSIVVLAKARFNLREHELMEAHARFVPFTAQTRMSGVDLDGSEIRKGAVDAIRGWSGRDLPPELDEAVERISRAGGTPLAVAKDEVPMGVVELKDIIKDGLVERFDQLRRMGIRTVMITGDNPLTAAAIAQESGVDDFLAEATPETKMALIKKEQEGGVLVAMTGDGTNDAPALAQADVGVAMNTGTSAAKEAGNMVDLDSNPTKLMDIVEIGKQLLITRGALTTFSIANDVAKYFAIIPAMFITTYPALDRLNVMNLSSPQSAILSAVIFNALIVALVPLALRGVRYRPVGAEGLLRRNLLIYGLGGIIVPFIGIKLIDMFLGLVKFP
jgi:K+-transporting ATPase ATPase B chain